MTTDNGQATAGQEYTVEWPCARNLPQSESIYHGDMDWCMLQVRYRQNLRRFDGFGVWRIIRDSDGAVVAESTLKHVDLAELDAIAADVRSHIQSLREVTS